MFVSLDSIRFWLLSLSTLHAVIGFVFDVRRSENKFGRYVHLLGFWSNGWKFRNSLPISKSLRYGSAQGGNNHPNAGCSQKLLKTLCFTLSNIGKVFEPV